ncbi:hypothetical protein [Flavobacterium chungnamense]|uniref:Uncharacterized protein n=1 Tax=Flavobacterium chungnamense TaxID=706182 RepID=A0ABP7UVV0_9FLAO
MFLNIAPNKVNDKIKPIKIPTPPNVGVLIICALLSEGVATRFFSFEIFIITGKDT